MWYAGTVVALNSAGRSTGPRSSSFFGVQSVGAFVVDARIAVVSHLKLLQYYPKVPVCTELQQVSFLVSQILMFTLLHSMPNLQCFLSWLRHKDRPVWNKTGMNTLAKVCLDLFSVLRLGNQLSLSMYA